MRMLKLYKLGAALLLTTYTVTSLAASPNTFANGRSYYGSLGGEPTNPRVVEVGAQRYINVKYGETITFRSDGKQFTWTFDGLDQLAVELSKFAPPGFATKPLTIYVPQDLSNRN